MDIRAAKVPFVLYAGSSHPELAKLIAEYVHKLSSVCMPSAQQCKQAQAGLGSNAPAKGVV